MVNTPPPNRRKLPPLRVPGPSGYPLRSIYSCIALLATVSKCRINLLLEEGTSPDSLWGRCHARSLPRHSYERVGCATRTCHRAVGAVAGRCDFLGATTAALKGYKLLSLSCVRRSFCVRLLAKIWPKLWGELTLHNLS